MKTTWFGLMSVISITAFDLACCPHDAPPPQMGPPPVAMAPNWPSDATCFENALLWGEDGTTQAFNILIVAIPEPDRDRDQAAFNAAKKAVDDANAGYINAVNAFVAGQQGDLTAAEQSATAALVELLAMVQQLAGGVQARPMAVPPPSGAAEAPSNQEIVKQAQKKLDDANKDATYLKKKSQSAQ
jgi:hypothetical protein